MASAVSSPPAGGTSGSVAEGDTIPAGAKIVFKLTGTDPDPVVLKMPLPRVRYQGAYRATQRSGPLREINTFFSAPAEADTVEAVEIDPAIAGKARAAVERMLEHG